MAQEIKFPVPKGFAAPEGSEPGKPFEVLASVELAEDGSLLLRALDGAPLADDKPKPESTTEEPDFLGAVERGMTPPE